MESETRRLDGFEVLVQRWDYQRGLSNQFLATGVCSPIRVVYATSGMYMASAVITDERVIIDNKLYWAACRNLDEAHYLCAILNTDQVTLAVRAFQSRGEHNPRDFHKHV